MANHKKPVTLPTFGKLPAAAPKVAAGEPHPPTAPKTIDPAKAPNFAPDALRLKPDAEVRNEQDQRAAKEAPKPTTHGLPSAPADVKPAITGLPFAAKAYNPEKIWPEAIQDGPMSLADVNAILADNYPGFEPTNVRGESAGLKFALPGGASITVERARIKKCANMEELRAYIDSVK